MDLKDIQNKQSLDIKVQSLLSDFQQLFTDLSSGEDTYKKAALLYYWLRDYKNYIKNETTFNPKYYPDFKRGNIVNLNLGFNLGSELGGLHYGIVLQNSNRRNPNLVIVPLSSLKTSKDPSKLHPSEIYLGEELYFKIQAKFESLKISIPTEINLLKEAVGRINSEENKKEFFFKLDELDQKEKLLLKTKKKLSVLKHGSIAVVNQIRTVSKMRVLDPTDKYDILFGLKLSNDGLNRIDKKIIELFTNQPWQPIQANVS